MVRGPRTATHSRSWASSDVYKGQRSGGTRLNMWTAVKQLLEGITYWARMQYAHRDLTGSNILVSYGDMIAGKIVGEHRMIGDLQDDHRVKTWKSLCQL